VVKAVPSHEGDIWIAGGSTGNAYGLWHSTDHGSTFTKLSNVTSADSIGFGMGAPGQSYMALYMLGIVGGVHGVFRSDDGGSSWIQINDSQHQYAQTCSITGDRVLGDKGYSSRKIRQYLKRRGIGYTIPRRSTETRTGPFNRTLYKERNRVERLINRLKQFWRVATRYEKRAVNFLAMVTIASILIWL
jgi:transposase